MFKNSKLIAFIMFFTHKLFLTFCNFQNSIISNIKYTKKSNKQNRVCNFAMELIKIENIVF